VTLWVGVLNLKDMTLNYVDAGHGYALLGPTPAAMQRLPIGEQLPVGVEADFDYVAQSVSLPESGCALLISDGIVEQPASPQAVDMSPFGMVGVERTLRELSPNADLIADLFSSVIHHAGQQALADDATAVLTSWSNS
ncbi:MAG TPA: SpoIIE family protein phosphatase, partial [Tepidisphaeraceae bacterium]|nr:SpoIIE family protein phosphatase [Tepidisphaeraceae bacterium]